jgi:hypothetical protein
MTPKHRALPSHGASRRPVRPASAAKNDLDFPLGSAILLDDLRQMSLALREQTLHVRAAAMEARAMSRDLRLRRHDCVGLIPSHGEQMRRTG